MNKKKSNNTTSTVKVSFAAIDQYVASNIVYPTEVIQRGSEMVYWGDGNDYPTYLQDLYNNVSTLHSIIDGSTDYAVGDDVSLNNISLGWDENIINRKGDSIEELIRWCIKDYFQYGGFAVQVIRNEGGQVAELYYLDMQYIRTNEKNEIFFYSEDFGKGNRSRKKYVIYPKFMQDSNEPSSILFIKNNISRVYPTPQYLASVKACEIERCADDFHLNAINNGFTGSYIINFNNGVPTDEIKAEIEDNFTEKFTGSSNAGRVMFSWNDNKENAVTTEKVDVEDFGEKYTNLAKHSRQQIFTAFRANPNLFGIPTESLGFSQEEYDSAFRLYNRTQIRPVQKRVVSAFDKIFGVKDSIIITPFSIGNNINE